MKKFRTVLVLISLAVVPLVVYWSTFNNYFLNSDFPQIQYASKALAQPGRLLHEFSDSWLGSRDFELYYRPLPLFLLVLNLSCSGVNPFGYHLLSLTLHVLCVWGVYFFTSELIPWMVSTGSRQQENENVSELGGVDYKTPAFVAALLFAIYPINAEAINWVGGRPDCAAGMFGVWALYFWLKEQTTAKLKFGILAMVSYLVSILFKETPIGIIFIPVLLGISKSGNWKVKFSDVLRSIWKLLAGLVIYLILRWHALGTVTGGYKGTEWKLLATSEYLNRWSDVAFLQKLFFPFNIALPLAVPIHHILSGLYVAILLLVVLDKESFKLRIKVTIFCAVFWLISILPEWRTAMMTHALAGGRSFYLAGIPICILISTLLVPLGRLAYWRRAVSYMVAATLILIFCLTDIFNNQVWNEAAETTQSFQLQLADLIKRTPKNLKVLLLNPPLSVAGQYGLNQALVSVTLAPPFLKEDLSDRVLCLDREHYGIRDANLINATSLRQALLASPTVAQWDPDLRVIRVFDLIPDMMRESEHSIIVSEEKSDYPGCTSFRLSIDPAINPLSCEAIEIEFSSEGTAKPGFAIVSWNENWKRAPTDIYKREVQVDLTGDAKPHVYRFNLAEQIGWYSHKKIEELYLNVYNVNNIRNVSARLASDARYVPRLRADMRFFRRLGAGIVPNQKGAVFICDTEVDDATGLIVELSQRNECFETYSRTYRDTEICKEASKRWMFEGRSATFTVPLSDVSAGFWCVRAASIDKNRRILGAFSDPVVFRIEDSSLR